MTGKTLPLLLVAGIALAGCTALQTGPDPRIVDSSVRQGLISELTGNADVVATVVNDGSAGQVEVTVTIRNGQGTVLDKFTQDVFMEEDERRRVTIPINVPDGAENYDITASPAQS